MTRVIQRMRAVGGVLVGVLLGALLTAPLWADTGTLYTLRASNLRYSTGEYGLKVVLTDATGAQVSSFSGVSHTDGGEFTVGTTAMTPVGGTYRSSLDSVDDGDAGAFAMLANRIQIVHLVDAMGVTASVGGGTQYTEADTDASITGTAMLMEGAANALVPAQGTAAAGLLVDISDATVAVTQSGTWSVRLQDGSGNALASNANGGTRALAMVVYDGSGNAVTTFGGSGGTSKTDDAPFAPATDLYTPGGGTYRTVRDALDDNDGGTIALTSVRGQLVSLENASGTTAWGTAGSAAAPVLSIQGIASMTAVATNVTQLAGASFAANNYLPVRLTDGSGYLTPNTQGTHDTGLGTITSITGPVLGGRASAAAITDVSADGDWVAQWFKRNGAAVAALEVGGTLVSATAGLPVSIIPTATSGWSTLNATAADSATACTNSAQVVKASAGAFGGYFINNPNTADSWVHIYNVAAASVTVGTTAPKLSFRIPGVAANSAAANWEIAAGVSFDTAIAVACTSTAGGNGAPSNALEVDILYK